MSENENPIGSERFDEMILFQSMKCLTEIWKEVTKSMTQYDFICRDLNNCLEKENRFLLDENILIDLLTSCVDILEDLQSRMPQLLPSSASLEAQKCIFEDFNVPDTQWVYQTSNQLDSTNLQLSAEIESLKAQIALLDDLDEVEDEDTLYLRADINEVVTDQNVKAAQIAMNEIIHKKSHFKQNQLEENLLQQSCSQESTKNEYLNQLTTTHKQLAKIFHEYSENLTVSKEFVHKISHEVEQLQNNATHFMSRLSTVFSQMKLKNKSEEQTIGTSTLTPAAATTTTTNSKIIKWLKYRKALQQLCEEIQENLKNLQEKICEAYCRTFSVSETSTVGLLCDVEVEDQLNGIRKKMSCMRDLVFALRLGLPGNPSSTAVTSTAAASSL